MWEENVELVRRSWDAWLSGHLDSLFADSWDREIAWDMAHFRDWPDRWYLGTEGVRRFLSEWLEVWTDYDVGVDEILAAPDGRIVTLAWQRGRGRESGLAMNMEWAQIATVTGGKVIRVENYDDRDEALEAAGLPELAMSDENVETFRRAVEAINRRDVKSLLTEADPAIELHMALQTLLGGEAAVYHGHEGVREYIRDMDEAFAEVQADYSEIRDLGDRVLAIGRIRARGRASGAELDSPVGTVVEVRDGKAMRVLTFLDPDDAVKAAGLSN